MTMTSNEYQKKLRLRLLAILEEATEHHPDGGYIAARHDELWHILDHRWEMWADLLADDPVNETRIKELHERMLRTADDERIVAWALEALDRYDALRAHKRVDDSARIEYPEDFWN